MSFPMDELIPGTAEHPAPEGLLGDVVLCPSVAAKQAAEAGHSAIEEMLLLTCHSILHLLDWTTTWRRMSGRSCSTSSAPCC